MPLLELPRLVPERPGRPEWGDTAAPMRDLTRSIAFEPDGWTPKRATEIAQLFDALAAAWPDHDTPERHDAFADALARGGPFPAGLCVEVGSGTGNATADLRTAFQHVVSLDLSRKMLLLASPGGLRIRADSAALPVRSGSAAVVVLINMFLFPAEVDRVVATGGVLVWVSSNGDETPIYLPPADVLRALPGAWDGVCAPAGWGTWLTARRRLVG